MADLSGKLLPKDPISRAKVRFFLDTVYMKFIPAFRSGFFVDGNPGVLLNAIDILQGLLPAVNAGRFAGGNELTIGDIAVGPFLARMEIFLQNDIGRYEQGMGLKLYDALQSDPKFTRYRQYIADIRSTESFKNTFDAASGCPIVI